MANEKVKQAVQMLDEGIDHLFESERYTQYLQMLGKFHNYSVNNCIMIMLQKPEATRVAGYQAWQKNFGRHVRKGEKGITILAPCAGKVTLIDENGDEVEKKYTYFRTATVFDVSQTDGEDLPEICNELTGDVSGYEVLVDKLITAAPVPVSFEDIDDGANGYYNDSEKRIAIRSGMSQTQTIKTMVHEIAHSLLHSGSAKTREAKEVEAESVAYVVCNSLGIDSSDYSFGYVAGWSSGKDKKELKASLELIRKTASEIIEKIA